MRTSALFRLLASVLALVFSTLLASPSTAQSTLKYGGLIELGSLLPDCSSDPQMPPHCSEQALLSVREERAAARREDSGDLTFLLPPALFNAMRFTLSYRPSTCRLELVRAALADGRQLSNSRPLSGISTTFTAATAPCFSPPSPDTVTRAMLLWHEGRTVGWVGCIRINNQTRTCSVTIVLHADVKNSVGHNRYVEINISPIAPGSIQNVLSRIGPSTEIALSLSGFSADDVRALSEYPYSIELDEGSRQLLMTDFPDLIVR